MNSFNKDLQYYKFCTYGFLRNLRFFEAFLIIYLMGKGISFTSIGILYTVREFAANILEIPSGIAADVLGRKKTLSASFLAYIASFFLFYLFTDTVFFGMAFFLYGVGEAFRSGTHKGMIADYLKSRSMKDMMIPYYGHTRSWSQRGLALSSLGAGLIVFVSGSYKIIFLFSIIPYFLNFALILSYPTFLDKSGTEKKQRKKQKIGRVFRSSVETLRDRNVVNLLNVSALHTAYLKAMKDYIQPILVSLVLTIPFLEEYNNDQRSAVFIGAVYFFIYILTSRASILAGRFKGSSSGSHAGLFSSVSLISGLAAGGVSGLFYLLHIPSASVVFFIFIYIIENLRKPVMTGYISENVDNSILTTVLSVQSQLKTIFTALIALSFGITADLLGIGQALLIISTILILFGMVSSFSLSRSQI